MTHTGRKETVVHLHSHTGRNSGCVLARTSCALCASLLAVLMNLNSGPLQIEKPQGHWDVNSHPHCCVTRVYQEYIIKWILALVEER